MNLSDVLNADLETVGQWIGQGFSWWAEELRGLVPRRWRGLFSGRPKLAVELTDGPEGFRVWLDGRRVETVDLPRDALLLLSSRDVLTREVQLPLLSARDLLRMVSLDIDRLTPFRADAVVVDVEVVARDPEAGRQTVLLGVLPKDAAVSALARAAELGVSASAVGMREAGDGTSHFDFLPAIRAAQGAGVSRRRELYWWAAAGGLFVLNLLALVLRDVADVSDLRRAVDGQHAAVSVALRLHQKVIGEYDQRAQWLRRRSQNEPLRVINAVTRALPAGAWVQHLEWNGQAIRLVGFKPGQFDVSAAIRGSPVFTNPRLASADASAKPGASQPFDLVADLEKAPGQ